MPQPKSTSAKKSQSKVGPLVSSSHLAGGAMPELSEFEFGLIMASHAFERWIVRGMAAAGVTELSALDTMVLHTVNHRGRPKRLADICLVLNVEDTYTVNYALKKLEKRGLIVSGRMGKEKTVEISATGEQACLIYREIREAVLERTVRELGFDSEQISKLSTMLRAISGQYDQAARTAASL